MSSDRELTTAPAPADPAAARRARELSELGDYVRLLADRMGLKDWTFEIEDDTREINPGEMIQSAISDKSTVVYALDDFFGATPEHRRFLCCRELLYCHFDADDLVPPGADNGLSAIAAAWAPALPLPLVGWMRRVTPPSAE